MTLISPVKDHTAILILIFMSASAFVGGLAEGQISNQAEDLRSETQNHEKNIERILTFINTIYSDELDSLGVAWGYLDDSYLFSRDLVQTNTSLTNEERNLYYSQIESLLVLADKWFKNTGSWLINSTFRDDPSLSQYVIATEDVSGFPFVIERTIWEIYDPVELIPIASLLEMWNFDEDVIQGVVQFIGNSTAIEELVFPDINDYYFILTSPLIIEQDKYNQKSQDLAELEQQSDRITAAINVITIATILAGIMISKMNDQENKSTLSKIRYDLEKEEQVLVKPDYTLGKIVVPIAAVLALFGLVLAILR